jgi:hypothetical protein
LPRARVACGQLACGDEASNSSGLRSRTSSRNHIVSSRGGYATGRSGGGSGSRVSTSAVVLRICGELSRLQVWDHDLLRRLWGRI